VIHLENRPAQLYVKISPDTLHMEKKQQINLSVRDLWRRRYNSMTQSKAAAQLPSAVESDHAHVVDGNALIRSLVSLPATFDELAALIFRILPKCRSLHFVTDSYYPSSIKDIERKWRGTSSPYVIAGSRTKMLCDFGQFMNNSHNKTQLITFILSEWQKAQYAASLVGRTVYFVCEELCSALTSSDGVTVSTSIISELSSSQEEADTRIVLHCLYQSRQCSSIVVQSPDTDVLVLLLAFSAKIPVNVLLQTGTGANKRLICIATLRQSIGTDVAEALPGLHAFTGCDTNNCFVRKGKKKPYELMKNNPEFINAFVHLPSLNAIFVHQSDVPANQILRICTKSRDGDRPSQEWRRASGRPPATWIHQICRDTGVTATEALQLAEDRPLWRTIATAGGFG